MTQKTDHERYLESYPHYQVDVNNPTMDGYGGSNVVSHYAWTDQDEKACITYGEDGKLKLHADKDIEIFKRVLMRITANLDDEESCMDN